MSYLTLDVTGTPLTVAIAQAGHAEPRTVGARVYSFAGNERSWIRAEPMVVQCVLANAPAATIRSYRALFANAAQVVCAGDVFNNASANVTCSGEITDEMEVGGSYWITTLTLYECTASTSIRTQALSAPSGVASPSVTLRAKRRITVSVAGLATTAVTMDTRGRRIAIAGIATATAALHAKRKVTTSAAGRGTPTVTMTKIP